ncbi:MAG TPA: cytidylate kinase-like family protein [Candidatus Paceibacterota bacterium]|nr:cytidylate kinase-like family protein [Candidatus Paceibacterota bacterium]
MNTPAGLERCLSFINCQMQPPERPVLFGEPTAYKCAITISRESGCGAHAFSEKLVQYLQPRNAPDAPPWTVFDKNLVQQVLEEHQLPSRLARFMPEDRVLEIDDIMDELFGLCPASWTLVQQISETILHLVEIGNVIILGRGANIVTAKLPHVLHVRMIGSAKRRINNMQCFEGVRLKEASDRIHHEDLGRQRYVKKHFNKDIDDPLLYHVVINTDLVSLEEAVPMIGELALKRKIPVAA